MNEWEYKVEVVNFPTIQEGINYLNTQGRQGWELVMATKGTLYFKRCLTKLSVLN